MPVLSQHALYCKESCTWSGASIRRPIGRLRPKDGFPTRRGDRTPPGGRLRRDGISGLTMRMSGICRLPSPEMPHRPTRRSSPPREQPKSSRPTRPISMNSRPTGCQTPGMVSRGMPVVREGIRSATFPVRSARIQGLLEKPVLSDQRLTALHRRPPRRRCRSTRPCPNTRLCRRRPLFRRCSAGNPSRMRDRGSRIRGLRKKASLQGR